MNEPIEALPMMPHPVPDQAFVPTAETGEIEYLKAQTRLLEHFFESSLICAVLLDGDFNFIRVNQAYAHACGRDVSAFPGRNHFDLYPSDARLIFEATVRDKRPYVAESRPFQFPDHPEWGLTYWDWSLVPVLDGQGEVELLLFYLHDVTQRVRAEQGLRETLGQVRGLSRRLVDIQEAERRRIARELHDEVGQGLTAIRITLENSLAKQGGGADPRLLDALAMVGEMAQGVRRIAHDLRPSMLDELGLPSALAWLLARCRDQAGIEIEFEHAGLGGRLPQDVETTIFRIGQEALTNVMRHAAATRVAVSIRVEGQEAVLRIEDYGRGFDPDAVGRSGESMGLQCMRERAVSLGGTLTMDATPGVGTRIVAALPIGREASTAREGSWP